MTATMRGFIALSVLAHAGAIAILSDPLPDAGTASPSLRVSLVRSQPNPASSAAAAAAPETGMTAKPEPAGATAPAYTRSPTPGKYTSAKLSSPGEKQTGAPAGMSRKTERKMTAHGNPVFAGVERPVARQAAEAGDVLRRLFSAHFHYPQLARRKGWQGEVRLGLRLEPDGSLTRIRIVQSSGFAILDNSAVKTARKVERVPDAARWLQGEWFDMVLPVQYRLSGSEAIAGVFRD